MNGAKLDAFLEKAWKGQWTTDDQAELQAHCLSHPEDARRWEEERGLDQALAQLPSAPLAANFTARVIQAVERETKRNRRSIWEWWPSHGWLDGRRWAVAGAAAALVATVIVQQRQETVRMERAESVAALTSVARLPSLEVLRDFEAIQRLSHVPEAPVASENDVTFLLTALP